MLYKEIYVYQLPLLIATLQHKTKTKSTPLYKIIKLTTTTHKQNPDLRKYYQSSTAYLRIAPLR